MENPESAPALSALVSQNATVSRQLYTRPAAPSNSASTEAANKRQKLDDASFEDPMMKHRYLAEYSTVEKLPASIAAKQPGAKPKKKTITNAVVKRPTQKLLEGPGGSSSKPGDGATREAGMDLTTKGTPQLVQPRPEWHPPWKLMRVISGHLGWVRALAVEPGNKWFASGAGDRTIKIWDMPTGGLKLTLTGHISTVRGLAVSPRHPYLFSCGEDKMVKCWDLETNKVIRHYHGHLSGVYTLAIHPTLDVLVTGGRDGVARVWDMRTRSNIHVLSGHKQTVSQLVCQEADPQVITASLDSTVRMWDLAAGKSMGVLTHHKKGVRALATHPEEFTFATGSTGSIKQWKCPEGAFMQNFEGHNAIINTLSVNQNNVFFSGADNGSMSFWDWKTGHRYQSMDTMAQPGSLDAEAGIMSSTFDRSGLRLICGEADKTIKIWKPDEKASPETHPLQWTPTLQHRKF
ncbi:WD40-repeat-containing domain protein [Emericellopsis atlantica]|uniref:Pre-mRNA-splicing factor PRP46 n=1 Tax=Emericellopsis atlantica TaxID=2614577 RepID=A0A9P7ZKW4_9HYPO|nr:WD40-repeat-containing domain protein [Emericellopsis atlantica]KAG9253581.1 WD40-repeat-containing domain protein [Emericellopsis atlantica]